MNIKRIPIGCVLVVDTVFLIVAAATEGLIHIDCGFSPLIKIGFEFGDSEYEIYDDLRFPIWRAFIIISILVTAFGAALSFALAVMDDLEQKIAVPLTAAVVIAIGALSALVCFSVIASDYNDIKKIYVGTICTTTLSYGFALIVLAFLMSVVCAIVSVLFVFIGNKEGQKVGVVHNSEPAAGQGGMQAGPWYPGQQGVAYSGQQGAAYPGQQGMAYPGQQGAAYPGQQGMAYPAQQGTAYPGQPEMAYPEQHGMAYPAQQGTAYPGQPGMAYPGQQGMTYPPGQGMAYPPGQQGSAPA